MKKTINDIILEVNRVRNAITMLDIQSEWPPTDDLVEMLSHYLDMILDTKVDI